VFDQRARDPGSSLNDRLAWLTDQLAPGASTVGPGGRLVRRWLPGGTAKRRFALVTVPVAVAALVAGSIAVFGGGPAAEPPPVLPSAKPVADVPEAKAALVISVVGRVRRPGLVSVPPGSRVADVLRAAGGAEPGADLSSLNLARKVSDGEQLAVGVPASAAEPGLAAGKVDLNTATAEQLDTLPGVGAVMARRIVEWRTRHGAFSKVEQLRDVEGIGESKFAKLREQVTVG